MKKFACATLVALGAGIASMLLATPLDAKGSGGSGWHGVSARPNIGPLARRGHPIARNIGPLAGRHLALLRHHHGHHGGRHHHRNDFGFWDYGYSDYGYSDYALSNYPNTDQYVDDANDVPPLPPRIVRPVIRTVENSKDVCAADHVKVAATGGGETTVTILRCY
jgi:hypothetical protein